MALPKGKVRITISLTEGSADWLYAVAGFSGMKSSEVVDRMLRYHAGVLPEDVQAGFEAMFEVVADSVDFIEYDEKEGWQ